MAASTSAKTQEGTSSRAFLVLKMPLSVPRKGAHEWRGRPLLNFRSATTFSSVGSSAIRARSVSGNKRVVFIWLCRSADFFDAKPQVFEALDDDAIRYSQPEVCSSCRLTNDVIPRAICGVGQIHKLARTPIAVELHDSTYRRASFQIRWRSDLSMHPRDRILSGCPLRDYRTAEFSKRLVRFTADRTILPRLERTMNQRTASLHKKKCVTEKQQLLKLQIRKLQPSAFRFIKDEIRDRSCVVAPGHLLTSSCGTYQEQMRLPSPSRL